MTSQPGGETQRVRDAEEAAKKAVAQALSEARAALLTLVVLDVDAEASVHEVLRTMSEGTERAINELCEAEYDSTKARLKAQANWHAAKLETSRIAAATRLEHKVIEARADFESQYDAKLRDRTAKDGSSLESELLQRIEEQSAELKRLGDAATMLSVTRAGLEATQAELSESNHRLASLTEDVRACTSSMARSLKKDLDADLASAEHGSLREQLLETINTYKQAGGKAVEEAAALRAECDGLLAKAEEREAAIVAAEAEVASHLCPVPFLLSLLAPLRMCPAPHAQHQLPITLILSPSPSPFTLALHPRPSPSPFTLIPSHPSPFTLYPLTPFTLHPHTLTLTSHLSPSPSPPLTSHLSPSPSPSP